MHYFVAVIIFHKQQVVSRSISNNSPPLDYVAKSPDTLVIATKRAFLLNQKQGYMISSSIAVVGLLANSAHFASNGLN